LCRGNNVIKGPLALRAYTLSWDWGTNPTQIIVDGSIKYDSKTWFGVDMKIEEVVSWSTFI
jgi:hypothetical protein